MNALRAITTGVLTALLRVYQVTLSPWIGPTCRFEPSCSSYFIEAVRRHGPLDGARLGLTRVARCHPFHPGGLDPVP